MLEGRAIWITGLPGCGKSILSEALKSLYPELVILRMDSLRQMATPFPTYSETERDILYRSLVYTAKIITDVGLNVIVDATGNKRQWRELAKETIGDFKVVYLRCPIEVCIKRESARMETLSAPKGIYDKGRQGGTVPGINVPYEEPINPDVIIDSDKTTVEEEAIILWKRCCFKASRKLSIPSNRRRLPRALLRKISSLRSAKA